jgi:CspA family cold shock protein
MSRYKEHRGVKRRGYDDDYTPPNQGPDGQPDYFSPRPNLTQGSEAVEATVKWFNADKGFGFVTVAGGSDAFLPSRRSSLEGPDHPGAEGPSGRRGRRGGCEHCSGAQQG